MDLIYDYESDWSSSHSDQGELGSREIREVYLVTYFNRQIPQAEQKGIAPCADASMVYTRLERFNGQILVNYRTKYVLHVVVYYFDTSNHGRNAIFRKLAQVTTSRHK